MTDTNAPAAPPSMAFVVDGQSDIEMTVTEDGHGGLTFSFAVLDSGDTADLRGFFFDINDPALVDGLQAEGPDVSGSQFEFGKVDNLGHGNNVHGDTTSDGLYDGGISFGKQGIGKGDDVQQTEFTLSHVDYALTLDDITDADFGFRLTSVGGNREDSLKLEGTFPEEPTIIPETDTPDDDPETDLPDDEPAPIDPEEDITDDPAPVPEDEEDPDTDPSPQEPVVDTPPVPEDEIGKGLLPERDGTPDNDPPDLPDTPSTDGSAESVPTEPDSDPAPSNDITAEDIPLVDIPEDEEPDPDATEDASSGDSLIGSMWNSFWSFF